MRGRTLTIALAAVAVLVAVSLSLVLMPGAPPEASPPPDRISAAEHQETIEALKPPKRERPAIALLALNEGTEVSDLLSSYGVLAESGVADLRIVAPDPDPIQLYPAGGSVEPQATTADFDEAYPDGADYVVIPAMEPRDDPAILAWIRAQHGKGATIVSVCNGSLTLSPAGLLDGRRATGHWFSVAKLRDRHPTMEWAPDRRYVVDRGVATSTGITSSVPLMIALVEAIAGRGEAETLAMRLGAPDWDARHRSSDFKLTFDHMKTAARNTLSLWRRERVGVEVDEGVGEIALGFMLDALSRTELVDVITVGGAEGTVRTRHGLRLLPETPAGAGPDIVLEPQADAPARSLDRELARIASRYDRPTAAYVALTMEHPWPLPSSARVTAD